MSRSLGLAAYRALSGRSTAQDSDTNRGRPEGELVWLHATSDMRFAALCDLGKRIKAQRRNLHVLITVANPSVARQRETFDGYDWFVYLQGDQNATATEFLDRWAPDLCIWTGGHLLPNLIANAAGRNIPMFLLDADASGFDARRRGWLPDPTRAGLGHFDQIWINTSNMDARLRKLGVPREKMRITAPLRSGVTPPACPDDEVASVSHDLAGRPIWLAAHVHSQEVAAVLSAHLDAVRLAHRLLLVITPAVSTPTGVMAEQVAASGLRHAIWSYGDAIEDNTQVLISDDPEDLPLWYRIAPLTFMASSLVAGHGGHGPFEAAALGSAILYGPNVRNHLTDYSRLAAAGAARIVKDGDTLGSAIIRLIAPDQAAAMALAGWEVVTESAHLVDDVLELVQTALDERLGSNAGA